MSRVVSGLAVMFGGIAILAICASTRMPEAAMVASFVAGLVMFFAGLFIALETDAPRSAGRSGDVNVNVYGQGHGQQPMAAWAQQPPQQPQIIMMAPPHGSGMAPNEVHGLIGQQVRALHMEMSEQMRQTQAHIAQMEHQRQIEHQQRMAALVAPYRPTIESEAVYRGSLTSAPQRALPKPSLAMAPARMLGRSLKRLVT